MTALGLIFTLLMLLVIVFYEPRTSEDQTEADRWRHHDD